MDHIDVADAKEHFDELVARAERGARGRVAAAQGWDDGALRFCQFPE
jgi:hypothetical protein